MSAFALPSTLHSRLASEHAQLKDEVEAVRQDNIQLVREHNHVKQVCEELRRLHEDDQREVTDMRMLHQQVPVAALLQGCYCCKLFPHCNTGTVLPFVDRREHLICLYYILNLAFTRQLSDKPLPDKLVCIDHNVR